MDYTLVYTINNEKSPETVYVNLTNKCDCSCTFCIRSHKDGVGDADTLWHKKDPALEEVTAAMDAFDFAGYQELVYCGYGEPTCALENLVASAKYAKEKYGIKVRINTNGLGNLYNGKDIVPELMDAVDVVSISLNAPNEKKYMEVTRPQFENAFQGMLDFASECREKGLEVRFTVVDVLPDEEIKASRQLAESMGIGLRVRHFA